MAELLFEIFCEEIPARMQKRAGEDLSKAVIAGFKAAGLEAKNVQSYAGPRRLVFTADIALRSPDISEERKGPRVGAPEQALAGFMRGAGLTDISQAQTRSDKKGDYYVAVIEKPGVDSAEIIANLIPDVMNTFPWPKSMKSGTSSFRWVRPLTSMICLLDGKCVDFEVGGIKTGTQTQGHRRHGKGPFTVKNFADYKKTLEGKGHVLLSTDARKDLILTDARKACAAKGLELVEDEGLLGEVAGLAEWPVVILGDMDPAFLELPDEVIRLTLKTHQKTFTVRDPKTGALAPHFIIVANQIAPDGGAAIKKGNGKVISARLSDAQFFQSEDRKKKLIDYYDKLDTVVFHKKLGSIRDKAERVIALAKVLAPKVGADPAKAEQAAKLAKCDLVTQTVVEFTSLQGQIGALMYAAEGGAPEIVTAIEQHYKPQGPSDSVPSDPVAVAVALADKLDTLVGFWAIDEKPTGSKDPFALRRAALGVVRIILENNLKIELLKSLLMQFLEVIFTRVSTATQVDMDTIDSVIESLGISDPIHLQMIDDLGEKARQKYKQDADFKLSYYIILNLLAFILERLKVYLRDQGVRYDVIDAVLANAGDDLVDIVNRVKAVQAFLETKDGADLLAGYKRAANILKAEAKKGELPTGAIGTLSQVEAKALQNALLEADKTIKPSLEKEDYANAMRALAGLRGPIDDFFEHVTVNDDQAEIRANNLRLLSLFCDTSHAIADFDAVQMPK